MRPWGLLLAALLLLPGASGAAGGGPFYISIIIDDIGDRLHAGHRVVGLPGPVACAFLPHSPHTDALARRAHALGKEVLLHLPMEASGGARPGPGTLTLAMSEPEFLAALRANLAAVPHAVGVNNHMGSQLTRHPRPMGWLMSELKARGDLFYVDSRTTAETVAEQSARAHALPVLRRHVFLDNEPTPEAVRASFRRLLTLARRQGMAVAIGHPHEATLRVLEAELPRLKAQGFELIPLTRMMDMQNQAGPWQASLSP